jgi:alpha-glucosidase
VTRIAESWWRNAVVYQIYPRSFADGNGDGIGDLRGVIARLDYLRWLAVDALWLTPISDSPNDDWGYDVADYCSVHPELGTMDDLDELVAQATSRGIRIMLDLVPNHTSARHPWFQAAHGSREAPRRDWYVWADPGPDGGPPNNWLSLFGGPAWTLDSCSGQYFLHSFLASQPDLNWWNEGVRAAFDEIVRFWLGRGIAGFRIDVAAGMIKDRSLRNNPPADNADHAIVRALGQRQEFNMDRPEVHDVLRRWRRIADGYDGDRVLLGEAYVLDAERLATYYGNGRDELHMAFNFLLLHSALQAGPIEEVIRAGTWLDRRDAWPAWAASNHDAGRMATRWARGNSDLARCALMLLLTLRGTPVLYYGDELGLTEIDVAPHAALDGGRSADQRPGRDRARTPMPWSDGPNAGFTNPRTRPWLPLGDRAGVDVATQAADLRSMLHLARDLIALRAREPDLRHGAMTVLDSPRGVLALERGAGHRVYLNLSDEPQVVELPRGRIALDTMRDLDGKDTAARYDLSAQRGLVVSLRGGVDRSP